jgi:hypothetical protein
MTQPGDQSFRWMRLRSALWWDLLLALTVAVVFLIAWLISDRFIGGKIYLMAAIPFMFGSATAAWLGGRWISDKIKDTEYGELVRLIDPEESALNYPYHLVAMVGFVGTGWCILSAVIIDGVKSRVLQGIIYAVTVAFIAWSLAGIVSLVRLSSRHQRRAARVRSLKEQADAALREAREAEDGTPDS